jgi:enoyl-CoA hydratase
MTYGNLEQLRVQVDGPIAWLVLNRPEKVNALSPTLLAELGEALDRTAEDDEIRVLVIRGEGRGFTSGYDISGRQRKSEPVDIAHDEAAMRKNIEYFLKIWDHPKPVIAAVHGVCLGGGTQLATFCDLTIVADDAMIGGPKLPLGGGYLMPLWVPYVSLKRIKYLSYVAGSSINGKQAADWGWATYSVPADELLANVESLARQIARTGSSTLRLKKKAINTAAQMMVDPRALMHLSAQANSMLHLSDEVAAIRELVVAHGLKGAIAEFEK